MTDPSTDPQLVELEPFDVALLRETVPVSDLTGFYDRAFGAVAEEIGRQGIGMVGPALAVYYGTPGDTVDVAAGFPTERVSEPAGAVTPVTLPGGPALQVVHVGSYDTLHESYGRLARWAGEQGLTPGPVMWETYLTEPTPDATEPMQTRITWPVQDSPD